MSTANSNPTGGSTQPENKLDDAKREAKAAASSLANEARTVAHDAAETARSEVETRAESAKQGVAGEVENVASALRKAAQSSRSGSPQERTFGQIADGLADVSETISNKDLGEIAGDISDFARRNPLVFLGGAAIVGFAATRFAKAGNKPATSGTPGAATSSYGASSYGSPGSTYGSSGSTGSMPAGGTASTSSTGLRTDTSKPGYPSAKGGTS